MGLGRIAYRGIDPITLSGRVLHCRADQGVHLEVGTELTTKKVEQWDDLSGLGHHFLQAATGNKPTMGIGPNGRDALVFNGTSGYMQVAYAGAQPETVVAIFQHGTPVGLYVFDGGFANVALTANTPIGYNQWTGGAATGFSVTPPDGVYARQTNVACCVFNATKSFARVNGSRVGFGTNTSSTHAQMYLGCLGNFTAFFRGNMMEFLIINRVLTEAEMIGLERYAGDRYNFFAG